MRRLRTIGLIALVAALAAPAVALEARQNRAAPRDQRGSGPGYDEGYRQGERAGQDHGRRGLQFNFSILGGYRQGDLGWRPQYGNRDRYRIEFRLGFESGYRAGYGQFDRRQGPYSYQRGSRSDFAYDNGYVDGYKEGINDGRHRHRNDPSAESRFRGGDHNYERWYGPKEAYRANYRGGFIEGYERGYRDGWY